MMIDLLLVHQKIIASKFWVNIFTKNFVKTQSLNNDFEEYLFFFVKSTNTVCKKEKHCFPYLHVI